MATTAVRPLAEDLHDRLLHTPSQNSGSINANGQEQYLFVSSTKRSEMPVNIRASPIPRKSSFEEGNQFSVNNRHDDVVSDCEVSSANGSFSSVTPTARPGASPRYEAFVMTGDKILRLNSKISPNFARIKQPELTEHTEILDCAISENPEEFEHEVLSKYQHTRRHKQLQEENKRAVPNSVSENTLAFNKPNSYSTEEQEDFDEDASKSSCVTVNAMWPTSRAGQALNGAPSSSSIPPPVTSHNDLSSGTDGAHHVGGQYIAAPGSPFLSSHSEPVSPAKPSFMSSGSRRPVKVDTECSSPEGLPESLTPHDNINTFIAFVASSNQDAHSNKHMCSDNEQLSGEEASFKLRLQALEVEMGQAISQKPVDVSAASRLAKRLYYLEGFRKSDVAPHLSKSNEFSALVVREYLNYFKFAGLRLDAALRHFLSRFCLVGESSERERIMAHFSRRYHECNPGVFESDDSVHTLACALLLLNSDLGQLTGKKMTCHQFIENLSQNSEFQYQRDLLKSLYDSLRSNPLQWARDFNDSENTVDSGLPSQSHLFDSKFLQIPDVDSQVEYKKGWVMRKCLIEPDGTKTPMGRRGWKMFYATLKGMVLYLHKDERGFKRGTYNTFRNATRIHHAIAMKASDYGKKQHVLRLQTATHAEYLFQTSDPDELNSWIDSINFVAACFSAPALPPPVSSHQTFHKLILPSATSKLSMKDQLCEHDKWISEIEGLLEEHRSNAPSRTAKPRVLQQYAEIEIYYQNELQRYQTYVFLLRSKMNEILAVDDNIPVSRSQSREMCERSLLAADDLATEGQGHSNETDRSSYKMAIYTCTGTDSSGFASDQEFASGPETNF